MVLVQMVPFVGLYECHEKCMEEHVKQILNVQPLKTHSC